MEQESQIKEELKTENGVKQEITAVKFEGDVGDGSATRRSSRRLQKVDVEAPQSYYQHVKY